MDHFQVHSNILDLGGHHYIEKPGQVLYIMQREWNFEVLVITQVIFSFVCYLFNFYFYKKSSIDACGHISQCM